MPSYRPQQWTVVGIARAQPARTLTGGPGTSNSGLTVTLLYMPTETLFAWPFNLASPDAKGVCYETLFTDKKNGVRLPPEGTMSVSLRVLADVIRSWMRIRKERSALAKRKGSDASLVVGSSVDAVVDNDEVLDDIIEYLGFHPLTPLERSIHLLRQVLPDRQDTDSLERPPLEAASSGDSEADTESSHGRSNSDASSSGDTADTSTEDIPKVNKSSPKLPKLQTALESERRTESEENTPVPQIRLMEATPKESDYKERDRVLEEATRRRSGNISPRLMGTLHEDASENGSDGGSATPKDSTKTNSTNRWEEHESTSPKSTPPLEAPAGGKTIKASRSAATSPSKVVFTDPFEGAARREDSKSSLSGSHDSLSVSSSSSKGSKVKLRPSFEGLRAKFGRGRGKSQ